MFCEILLFKEENSDASRISFSTCELIGMQTVNMF